jgi:hypothetical protein
MLWLALSGLLCAQERQTEGSRKLAVGRQGRWEKFTRHLSIPDRRQGC